MNEAVATSFTCHGCFPALLPIAYGKGWPSSYNVDDMHKHISINSVALASKSQLQETSRAEQSRVSQGEAL
ncbi:hypothetical protein AUEXF2481DRAFT_44207 [Aureobasidium subglaciale EXF-2481]|uniref:Uncharacterized protein n=1 Tax=Aureobasidium subglaciale (strain EXF-2481) TaxID=1043005 RepID=A0A074YB52_AURSE|nr:uncharacterized protein AUEXF2481DRAFT_44207 [Aureobasidium subglaciale EXF-2481]KEQ91392.1 hypothetical protein AUEXF2481DRAFT_44207 [Aureobasidium subglaciale EXF-2481]